eukprot:2068684-Prymnesium_polylepis.2
MSRDVGRGGHEHQGSRLEPTVCGAQAAQSTLWTGGAGGQSCVRARGAPMCGEPLKPPIRRRKLARVSLDGPVGEDGRIRHAGAAMLTGKVDEQPVRQLNERPVRDLRVDCVLVAIAGVVAAGLVVDG